MVDSKENTLETEENLCVFLYPKRFQRRSQINRHSKLVITRVLIISIRILSEYYSSNNSAVIKCAKFRLHELRLKIRRKIYDRSK